jgi:hypothetical protein
MGNMGTCSICGLPHPCDGKVPTMGSWRAEAVRLALQVESLEHEVGTLKEKLRRIAGYVHSAWREDVGDQE